MSYLYIISATAGLVCFGYDLAASHRIDGCSFGCRVIYAMVRAISLEYGVVATVRKLRRYAVEVERGLQECSLEAVTVGIVE